MLLIASPAFFAINSVKGDSNAVIINAASTNQTTIADAINTCTLNWTADPSTVKLAMVFHALPLSYYDTLIQQCVSSKDWVEVIRVKRFSEIDGYDSLIIEQATQQALANMPMLKSLPSNWPTNDPSYFGVYQRFILDAYRYAVQYNQTSKWNATAAYQDLLATYQKAGKPSLAYDPITLTISTTLPRYYDEAAETLDSFVKLKGDDAGLWDYIQNQFWTGEIYGYNGLNQYECEVGSFAMIIGYYYVVSGQNLTNFDRVYLDLYNKLLAEGMNSVAWGVPGVLRHAETNPQLRLENTLNAVQALQTYVGLSTWENSFVNLLTGSNKAWTALLNSTIYSNGQFKSTEPGSFLDDATAEGMMTLLLEGIIPGTGSLAMPLNDEGYQDAYGLSPASLFGFDYQNTTLRIPVNPGELKFQFGTETVSYTFPSAGVYEVHFDSSWNNIDSVQKLGPLDKQFQYFLSPINPPVASFDCTNLSPTTNEPVTFDASSSLPGSNKANQMPIIQYNWDLGDGNTMVTKVATITHTYDRAGTYKVNLSVTDSENFNDSTVQTFTIYVPLTLSYSVQNNVFGNFAPTLTYWFNGTQRTANLTNSPASYALDAGTLWAVTSLLPNSSSTERWQTTQQTKGIANSTYASNFVYYHQYLVNASYSVVGGGTADAPTLSSTSFDFTSPQVLTTTPTEMWLDNGAAYSVTKTLPRSNSSERWVSNSTLQGIISQPLNIELIYYHQYFLTNQPNPSIGGSVSPESGWYNAGVSLQIMALPNSDWQFQNWTGSNKDAYSGPNNLQWVNVTSAINQTANFCPSLTIEASDQASVIYSYESITGSIPAGTSQTIYAPYGTNITLIAEPAFFVYGFSGWSGSVTSNESSILVTSSIPLRLRANYSYNNMNIALMTSGIVTLTICMLIIGRKLRKKTNVAKST